MRKQKEPVSAVIQYKGGRISAKKGVRYWPRRAVIGLIHLYRKLRPRATRGCCKYIPTCSQYGEEAVERYGALLGGVLALWRILRCNPFSRGGYDLSLIHISEPTRPY